jgi:hypothetical protein
LLRRFTPRNDRKEKIPRVNEWIPAGKVRFFTNRATCAKLFSIR